MMKNAEEAGPEQNATLLEWFLRVHSDTPRSRAKQFILAGRVSVDGQVLRKPHQVLPNPRGGLKLLGRHALSVNCDTGWKIHPRVTVLHLDPALGVLNKGPGLVSVEDGEHLSAAGILGDFLAGRLRPRDRAAAGKTIPPMLRKLQPLPVHRLDQYTSGLFCVAFQEETRASLIDQLRRGEIEREYIAYVEGRPQSDSGVWRTWLELTGEEGRQTVAQAPSAGDSKTSEAVTHFQVITQYSSPGGLAFAKLRLRLETGLKHQIRIQAARAGVPLIGDRIYNPNYRPGGPPPDVPFDRQALHAETLALNHPRNPRQRLSWRAEPPDDLSRLEHVLRGLPRSPVGGRPAT